MILIADSGSTKTEWRLSDKGASIRQIHTAGINPYFQTEEEIEATIGHALSLIAEEEKSAVESVFFYGAGCTSPEKNRPIIDALQKRLPAATATHVDSDLMGAARSLCGREAGIACILGTGSNSCLYNGKEIVKNIPPLGYILGDEGSGAELGRMLVSDYLKNQLPRPLADKFRRRYGLTAAVVLEHVYKRPFPNRYLANFSFFLMENIGEPAVRDLVLQSFRSFFIRNVMQYDGSGQLPISFTGSVAFHYRDILWKAAWTLSLTVKRIEPTPMPGLLAYHS
jgi:N-acetylglucosamine kinase-like BadF-type ATPase